MILIILLATPIERDIGLEYKYEETKLPEYDLPIKRQKTDLEVYEPDAHKGEQILQDKIQCAKNMERLKPKQEENTVSVVKNLLILGKGDKPGRRKKHVNR